MLAIECHAWYFLKIMLNKALNSYTLYFMCSCLLNICGEALSSHSNDNVCSGSLSADLLVDRAGSLVGVVVTPESKVHLVFLHAQGC